MKFFIAPFSTPDQFEVLPALTIRANRCDCGCSHVHGYDIGLHWMSWGIGAGVEFDR